MLVVVWNLLGIVMNCEKIMGKWLVSYLLFVIFCDCQVFSKMVGVSKYFVVVVRGW